MCQGHGEQCLLTVIILLHDSLDLPGLSCLVPVLKPAHSHLSLSLWIIGHEDEGTEELGQRRGGCSPPECLKD